jgi:hypothetical protein
MLDRFSSPGLARAILSGVREDLTGHLDHVVCQFAVAAPAAA